MATAINPQQQSRVAIPTPQRLDLVPIQQAISNIRERMNAADTRIVTLDLMINALKQGGNTDSAKLAKQISDLSKYVLNDLKVRVDTLEQVAGFHYGPTPPAFPVLPGFRWFSSDTGRAYTRIDDGDSVQWVET